VSDSIDTAPEAMQPSEECTFGSYLRAMRRRAKMSAPTLAKQLVVSLSYYVRVEQGTRAPFGEDRWESLLAIGADAEQLRALSVDYWADRAGRTTGRPTAQDRLCVPPGQPRSSTWEELDWEDDDWCWFVVAHHPDGLTHDQISALTGWSPNHVDQLERSALAKLARHKEALEALGCLELLHQHRDGMWNAALEVQ
jgi:transcriptional regulator with XRE-family HTH domain